MKASLLAQKYLSAIFVATLAMAAPLHGQTLFSDNFDTDTSAQWSVFNGSGDGTPDFTVLFSFDYSTNRYVANGVTNFIPSAPNSTGGTTRGVKVAVNKSDDVAATAAVSLYPTGLVFSNNYALRFDMWINYNGPAYGGTGSTEFGTFGINHVGDKVNWNLGPTGDGVWFAVSGEAGAARDYRAYVGDNASSAVELQGIDAGFLDRDGNGTPEAELNNAADANSPLNLLFPIPPFETPGMPGKQWVQVEVRQRTNDTGTLVATWLINGYVIAEHSQGATTFNQTQGTVMIGTMDPFASIASPKEDNFVIFDNVRVANLATETSPPVLSIESTDTAASEPGADTAQITVSRTGDTSSPLTIPLRITGTASNGVDYATLANSVTLPAGVASTNVTVTPLNDSIGEATETITVTLAGGTQYEVREKVFVRIDLADDGDVPTATLTARKPVAYELNPARIGQFAVNFSTPNASDTAVRYLVAGTATNGVDYSTIPGTVIVPAGSTNAFVNISARDNSAIDSNRMVILTLTNNTGYVLGAATNATVTIRNDDLPPGTVAFSENFDTDHTANWTVNPSGGANTTDTVADVFFDYSTVGIPPAPNTTGGTTRGLKLQANLTTGVFGGLSVSPNGQAFSGDYRVRFDVWQSFNGPLPAGGNGSTQVTGAGVGTAGSTPQWAGGTQDSVWFGATADGGSGVDYRAYSSAASTGYTPSSGVFAAGTSTAPDARNNSHLYYAEFGLEAAPAAQLASFPDQAGETFVGASGFQWRDAVITRQGNTISWSLDGLLLATVDASTVTLGGSNILFNYFDINAGSSTDIDSPFVAFGLVDNVRVEILATSPQAPNIQTIAIGGGNVQIDFSGATSDTPTAFSLLGSANVASSYANEAGASITQLSPGSFRVTAPVNGTLRFYRIQR
jgi:Calx-beta domain-containing protein